MEEEVDVKENSNTTIEQENAKIEALRTETTEEAADKIPPEEVSEEVETLRSRSASVHVKKTEEEEIKDEKRLKGPHALVGTLECPENESDRKKLISNALQQEDEFLEYLMSLPAASSGAKEKQEKPKEQPPAQPLLTRSMSSYGGNVSSGGGAKVGLDHLDNLCKLMEQLGDLREQNSKLQKRVQYLEDLKNLQEMHKQLQEESNQREMQQAAFLQTLQQHRELSAKRHQHRRLIEASFPTPASIDKGEGSEDSLAITSLNSKRNDKCKSMTNGKFRESLLRYQQRERSRSVGIEEIKQDTGFGEKSGKDAGDRTKHRIQPTKQKRRSVAGITSGTKAKVSKWTKVKEAFRWEKASVVMLPEAKSQDSGIAGISGGGPSSEDTRYLRVPSGDSKSGDNLLSVSPVDSVLSGLSSACSSGGQSPGYLPCQHPLSDFSLPPATALSSSSSSEDLDIDLTFTDILAEYGPQRSASATDSTGGRLLIQDTRRRSLSQMPEEEDASRRSKSLDGDAVIGNSAYIARHFASKDSFANTGKLPHQKSHKTPWGKVKDIIQTRKDSLKKRHRQGKTDSGSKGAIEAAPSDHEEDPTPSEHNRDSPEKEGETIGIKPPSTKPRIEVNEEGASLKTSSNKRQQSKTSTASLDGHLQTGESSPTNRRLTPVLTITLPSTEELRSLTTISTEQAPVRSKSTSSKPPPSPQSEDRIHKISTASAPVSSGPSKTHHGGICRCDQQVGEDDASKSDSLKRQVSLSRPTSASAGTSPPVHRRASKWTKVKKAFLTSAPGRREDDGTGRISSSVPSSPNRNSSFFDEMDTDELSSGEYGDINMAKTRQEDGGEMEGAAAQREASAQSASIHAEIQRNYEELQQKLSQEFHKKLHEWERMKASSSGASSSCRGAAGGDDGVLHHDKGFRRKMEEWERMKHHQQSQAKHRDSVALQQLDEDNLSPDFRKKLQEWQRIKKSLPAGTTPQSTGENFASASAVPPQFRKKIADWQLWRSGSGKSDGQHRSEDQPEDFLRKQQEWKAASSSPSPETVTMQSGQESQERASGTKTPSPGIVRKDSTGQSKAGNKKSAAANKSSGAVTVTDGPGSSKEKYDGNIGTKGGCVVGKGHQKGKSQKEKELQWLEKELHKIEREKQRLEREREKYLEREARLEKMRRAMGSGAREQEVLIQTSTGFFRFQGISEKFTRRLYEWEKARGIGPEASTFALLDPGYRLHADGKSSGHGGGSDSVETNLLSRSKSASSVTNLGTGVTNVGTSSLSLNDVEVLEQAEAATLEDSRAASEPHLRTTDGTEDVPEDDEPAAVIVDVEDVIEETAAPLPVTPVVQSQTPVYCYAPEEVTRLIDSSGSDSERDGSKLVQRNDSVRTESSYKLLEENMSLLNKLKLKEDICRKLENEIENLEGKIDDVAKTRKKELQRLRREETDLQVQSEGEQTVTEMSDGAHESLVAELRARIRELEQRQERLLREGETLQDSFAEHSEQQAALAQNLVGKMKQLQEANINMASCDQSEPLQQSSSSHPEHQVDAVTLVQDLSTQLLNLAEKLEIALADRSREVHNLRFELQDKRRMQRKLRAGQHWFSEEGMSVSMGSLAETDAATDVRGTSVILPRQSSEELTQLPSLLTNKVLELKEGLNYLCAISGTTTPDNQATKDSTLEQATVDPDTSATFILKFDKKSEETEDRNKNVRQRMEHEPSTVVQVDSEGNTSPVTCVTITPAFWKRRDKSQNSQEKESSTLDSCCQSVVTVSSDVFNKRDTSPAEEISCSNRYSFCSAVSSASTTSSICDDDADDDDGDSCVSEAEGQEHRLTAALRSDKSANKKEDVSEESINDSDDDKSSDDEAEDDDDDDDDDGDTKTIIKCDRASDSLRSRCYDTGDFHGERTFMDSKRDPSPGYYETEVPTSQADKNGIGRQRKLLKTRRISDTHVRYKRDIGHKNVPQGDIRKCESGGSTCNIDSAQSVGCSDLQDNRRNSTHLLVQSCQKNDSQDSTNQRNEYEEEEGESKSVVSNALVYEGSRSPYRLCYPFSRADRLSKANETSSSTVTPYSAKNLTESGGCRPMPTPDNVFVKTTRKIFSPVRRDSKGKASSVIGYVVGEATVPSESEGTEVFQRNEQSLTVNSPITTNVARKEHSGSSLNENIRDIHTNGKNGNNCMSTPSWMFTRTRSQSSSPALVRRKIPIATEKISNETSSVSDSNGFSGFQKKSSNESSRSELEETKTLNLSIKPVFDSDTFPDAKLEESTKNSENKCSLKNECGKYESSSNLKRESDIQREQSIDKNKSEKGDVSLSSPRPVTPSANFPSLPQSPNPSRRDLIKIVSKETAPSIRMMIAKYNQKLTEQQEGGRSPEVGGSGSASPVAWRSPVAERRVRAQMEKYQEEVQRVLQQGRSQISAGRCGGSEVQKSASAGIIRAPECGSDIKPEGELSSADKDTALNKSPSLITQRQGILKSSSAGTIKPVTSISLAPVTEQINTTVEKINERMLPAEHVKETPVQILLNTTVTKPPSPRLNISQSPSSPSSPEIGLHHSSPPPSRLRALRLQRAKEEFLTRGPGGRSWSSEVGTPSTGTASASVSPEPFWEPVTSPDKDREIARPEIRLRDICNKNPSRLSQISVGSESSYDGSVVVPGCSKRKSSLENEDGLLLIKSASAGMINVDPHTYKKFYNQRGPMVQPKNSNGQDSQEGKSKSQQCSKFGISSIASRFRRVKMRKSKERDSGKMNTVSMLCRQSLLVDLHLSKGGSNHGETDTPGPSTSKSCPSSPVLQRSSSGEKPGGSGTSSTPTSWIFNPARKIFKPK